MDHLQRDYRLIEDGYGTTMLNLVVAKGYVGRLGTSTRTPARTGLHRPPDSHALIWGPPSMRVANAVGFGWCASTAF